MSSIIESHGRTFKIARYPRLPSHDRQGLDEYPWYVQETTHGDDRDDYGRMGSHREAIELALNMATTTQPKHT